MFAMSRGISLRAAICSPRAAVRRLGRSIDRRFTITNVPGSFAAGDVRHNSVKRVASAVGEGAMAVTFVHKFLAEHAG